jgi:hypothetical protein
MGEEFIFAKSCLDHEAMHLLQVFIAPIVVNVLVSASTLAGEDNVLLKKHLYDIYHLYAVFDDVKNDNGVNEFNSKWASCVKATQYNC